MPNLLSRIACCLLFGLAFMQRCHGQACEEDSLFLKFRSALQIEHDETNGHVAWDDEIRAAFYLLMDTYPYEKLVKYTEDINPAVRAQIFVGLAQKNASEELLSEILARHVNDTAEFAIKSGCVTIPWKVNEYMQFVLDLIGDHKVDCVDFKSKLAAVRSRLDHSFRLMIPGARRNIIDKDSLLGMDGLVCLPAEIEIVSFTVMTRKSTVCTSNVFTDEVRELIRALKPGDKVYFDEIRGRGPDNRIRNFGSIAFVIQ